MTDMKELLPAYRELHNAIGVGWASFKKVVLFDIKDEELLEKLRVTFFAGAIYSATRAKKARKIENAKKHGQKTNH